jgi:hypothetical protein
MVRGRISIGGANKYPLCHCCQRGRKLISNKKKKKIKEKVAINAKGGEC